jgi:chromosomal replication initiation ATPase DnaA
MWELRRRTKLSTPQIARLLGLSNHTTVLHGIHRHKKRLAERMAAE